MAFTGGFCACFFGAGSSSELDEESELVERDDGAAALMVAGLVLGLGVEALGGCSGRLHLLAAGPGTGSACVKISGLEEGVLLAGGLVFRLLRETWGDRVDGTCHSGCSSETGASCSSHRLGRGVRLRDLRLP